MDKIKRLHFEDHGQDFLWWDLDKDGTVVNCGPFQQSIWIGSKLVNYSETVLKTGDRIFFVTNRNPDLMQLRYPIENIEEMEVTDV
ncbi:hypothetical protein [Mongoliibacter ruber]|uniref:Uncharacterized protein n=1 Tax=Mongoliibacter ruber TaxID=1750599 RepID=A0A2T0WV98_9BACT|nr:hypothetical protein [Mongoliibacter ruber]PRY90615.1 hypothetical protein CLW00_101279 [Mongoliibacter ruber]